MTTADLQGVVRGRTFRTTRSAAAALRPPDLVGRDLSAWGIGTPCAESARQTGWSQTQPVDR